MNTLQQVTQLVRGQGRPLMFADSISAPASTICPPAPSRSPMLPVTKVFFTVSLRGAVRVLIFRLNVTNRREVHANYESKAECTSQEPQPLALRGEVQASWALIYVQFSKRTPSGFMGAGQDAAISSRRTPSERAALPFPQPSGNHLRRGSGSGQVAWAPIFTMSSSGMQKTCARQSRSRTICPANQPRRSSVKRTHSLWRVTRKGPQRDRREMSLPFSFQPLMRRAESHIRRAVLSVCRALHLFPLATPIHGVGVAHTYTHSPATAVRGAGGRISAGVNLAPAL